MNTVTTLRTEYLHFANRSIETVLIGGIKILYIYNHQGQYFKLFESIGTLSNYLSGQKVKTRAEFIDEIEMDEFLLNLDI
jgi:hypothetical protein